MFKEFQEFRFALLLEENSKDESSFVVSPSAEIFGKHIVRDGATHIGEEMFAISFEFHGRSFRNCFCLLVCLSAGHAVVLSFD